ncbi:MAG: 4Fe-4S binding protein [Bdellovibrionales bacterium]
MWKLLINHLRFLFGHIYRTFLIPPFTVEYPFVVKSLPGAARASIKNNFKECTGCLKCEAICPMNAIQIQGFEYSSSIRRPSTSKGVPFEREIESFKVDYNSCVMCGICVTNCPTESLGFAKNFVYPEFQTKNLVIDLVHVPRSMRAGVTHEVPLSP